MGFAKLPLTRMHGFGMSSFSASTFTLHSPVITKGGQYKQLIRTKIKEKKVNDGLADFWYQVAQASKCCECLAFLNKNIHSYNRSASTHK